MYSIPSQIYGIGISSLALISLYCRFTTWCLRIKHESHNTLYVLWCGIFSDSLVDASVWLFTLRTKARLYKGWKVLCIFEDLLVPLSSLYWEHLSLSLTGIWDLNLGFQLVWCWEHLLDTRLDILLTCLLACNFAITLAHGKELWLKFNLA